MRRSSSLKKQMEDQKQRWMRTFEAECMRLKPEWEDPRNRPQDFWDSATYYYNESYTPFAAAREAVANAAREVFVSAQSQPFPEQPETWVCENCERTHDFEPGRCMSCGSSDLRQVE